LKDIVVVSSKPEEGSSVGGKIVCPCGGDAFALMFPGQTHEYNGEIIPCMAEIDGNFFFVLRADCLRCRAQHLLFDADFHGWNGFICHDEVQASLPRPNLVAWSCRDCGGEAHRLDLSISGESLDDFKENAGDDFPAESWPEAFGWLSVSVSCVSCGETTEELVSLETM
jgi:hypothetical protein